MKNGVIAFGITLILSPVWTDASAQSVWGEAIEGVQIQLSVATNAPRRPTGEMPALEVRLRNTGSAPATYSWEAIGHANLEIDGVWYVETWAGSCCSGRVTVAPGDSSAAIIINYDRKNIFDPGSSPVRFLSLAPGRHTIRVRADSNDRFDIHTPQRRGLRLISNAITIEIPNGTSAAPPAQNPVWIHATLTTDKSNFFIGEDVAVKYCVENASGRRLQANATDFNPVVSDASGSLMPPGWSISRTGKPDWPRR